MKNLTTEIRGIAKKLLDDKRVDLIVGFERGTLPLRSTPCFVRRSKEVRRLIWNASCENNLARYLPKRTERIGIVAKGCDTRSIVGLIQESQITREQVFIIGVPCSGMIDRKKVDATVDGKEVFEADERDGEVILKGRDFELSVSKNELLHNSCQTCRNKNPVIFDVLVGDKIEEDGKVDEYKDITAFEALSSEERWQSFTREISKCFRCYACRNACPLCYCQECFVDSSQPQWIGKTLNFGDIAIYHLIRAFHTTGRCVDCGACDRACPMGIDLRKLTKKIEKDVQELFHYRAGMSVENIPLLATFNPDDPQEFVR